MNNRRQYHKLDTENRIRFYEQEFYVLSNFSAFAIHDLRSGHLFPTVEHAYHFRRFDGFDSKVAQKILHARSAHVAFKIAQEYKERQDPEWDTIKVHVMAELLRVKVDQHEYVRRKLLQTGQAELVEDSWRDDFWGWGSDTYGKNVLGKLWMELRDELTWKEKNITVDVVPFGKLGHKGSVTIRVFGEEIRFSELFPDTTPLGEMMNLLSEKATRLYREAYIKSDVASYVKEPREENQ